MDVSTVSGQVSQTLSAALHSSLRFFHPPAGAPPAAYLTGCLPLTGREYAGYHVPRNYPRSLGLTRTPVAQHLRWRTLEPPSLATYRFGPSLISTFGLFSVTALQ